MDVLYGYLNKTGVKKMEIVIDSQIINKGKKSNLYNYYYILNNQRISAIFQASLDKINQIKRELKNDKRKSKVQNR